MPYQWLLFDMDGTLFDYHQAEQSALRHTFAQLAIPFREDYLLTYQTVNRQLWLDFEQGQITQAKLRTYRFELLLEAIKIEHDPHLFSHHYLTQLGRGTFLTAGAEDVISALQGRFHLAIITNGLKDVQRSRLAVSPFGDTFEIVVISDEVGAAKPDARIFEITFEQMNHPGKNEVLMIGDSLTSDIQGGYDYGIDTCWVNPDGLIDRQAMSTFEIRQLSELPGILQVT